MKSRMQTLKMFVAAAVICGVAIASVTELETVKNTHLQPSIMSFTGGIPPVCPTGGCSASERL